MEKTDITASAKSAERSIFGRSPDRNSLNLRIIPPIKKGSGHIPNHTQI
jgi:hypothetical protein